MLFVVMFHSLIFGNHETTVDDLGGRFLILLFRARATYHIGTVVDSALWARPAGHGHTFKCTKGITIIPMTNKVKNKPINKSQASMSAIAILAQ